MLNVRPGLSERRDGIEFPHRRPPESPHLGKNEPHPVALLAAPAQLINNSLIHAAALGPSRTAAARRRLKTLKKRIPSLPGEIEDPASFLRLQTYANRLKGLIGGDSNIRLPSQLSAHLGTYQGDSPQSPLCPACKVRFQGLRGGYVSEMVPARWIAVKRPCIWATSKSNCSMICCTLWER